MTFQVTLIDLSKLLHVCSIGLVPGASFQWREPKLSHIDFGEDDAEHARSFQRSVVHETVLPLLAKGPPALGVIAALAQVLYEPLLEIEDVSEFLEKVVTDVQSILACILTLSGKMVRSADVDKVMGARTPGVLLRVAQAINAAPCWSGKYSTYLRLATATQQHGPLLQATIEQLKQENPEMSVISDAVHKLPCWRDALAAGSLHLLMAFACSVKAKIFPALVFQSQCTVAGNTVTCSTGSVRDTCGLQGFKSQISGTQKLWSPG